MKRACLDNHILIWAVRGISTPGQESMIPRAAALLVDLDEANADILVPSVVVAEFLAGAPKETHTELLNVLNARFQLPPFDVRAAAVAAGLWRDYAARNPNLRERLKEEFPGTKSVKIKADVQILATAIARSASVLYTHDGTLRAIADGLIEVRELPPPRPHQADLL
jgi:predicted nucleic acid-binding protein